MTRKFVKNETFKIIKAKDFKTGMSYEGVYQGHRTRKIQKRNEQGIPTGELQDLIDHKFISDTDEKFIIPEDAGLRVAISEAEMSKDKYYQITKLEQMELQGGQRCNQYEILRSV